MRHNVRRSALLGAAGDHFREDAKVQLHKIDFNCRRIPTAECQCPKENGCNLQFCSTTTSILTVLRSDPATYLGEHGPAGDIIIILAGRSSIICMRRFEGCLSFCAKAGQSQGPIWFWKHLELLVV